MSEKLSSGFVRATAALSLLVTLGGCAEMQQSAERVIDDVQTIGRVATRSVGGSCNAFKAEEDLARAHPRAVHDAVTRPVVALAVQHGSSEFLDIGAKAFAIRRHSPSWEPGVHRALVTAAHAFAPEKNRETGRWEARRRVRVLMHGIDDSRTGGFAGVPTEAPSAARLQAVWEIDPRLVVIPDEYDPSTGNYDVAMVALGAGGRKLQTTLTDKQQPLNQLPIVQLAETMPAPYAQAVYATRFLGNDLAAGWTPLGVEHGRVLDARLIGDARSQLVPTSLAGGPSDSGTPMVTFENVCDAGNLQPLAIGMAIQMPNAARAGETPKTSTGIDILPASVIAKVRDDYRHRINEAVESSRPRGK